MIIGGIVRTNKKIAFFLTPTSSLLHFLQPRETKENSSVVLLNSFLVGINMIIGGIVLTNEIAFFFIIVPLIMFYWKNSKCSTVFVYYV